ncbi:hypothetical protein V8C42DRAFT_347369 [Trichoderma barbatum]
MQFSVLLALLPLASALPQAPAADTPAVDAPVVDAPVVDAAAPEAPVAEAPAAEATGCDVALERCLAAASRIEPLSNLWHRSSCYRTAGRCYQSESVEAKRDAADATNDNEKRPLWSDFGGVWPGYSSPNFLGRKRDAIDDTDGLLWSDFGNVWPGYNSPNFLGRKRDAVETASDNEKRLLWSDFGGVWPGYSSPNFLGRKRDSVEARKDWYAECYGNLADCRHAGGWEQCWADLETCLYSS